ncbi:hypothetical protein NMG60_11021128 [Bertholletia excelsa]
MDLHQEYIIRLESLKKPSRTSVPKFGGWDQQAYGSTNYSMVFSQARAAKKRRKNDIYQHNVKDKQELVTTQEQHNHQEDDTTMTREERMEAVPPQQGFSTFKSSSEEAVVNSQAHATKKQDKDYANRQNIRDGQELIAKQQHQDNKMMTPDQMSVPKFGAWDHKASGPTDHAIVISQARATKKQDKNNANCQNIGNELELAWDHEAPGPTDHAIVISQVCATKKQDKHYANRQNIGNEQELTAKQQHHHNKEDNNMMMPNWMSVSKIGGWDHKALGPPKARCTKKRNKRDFNCHSLGSEKELVTKQKSHNSQEHDTTMVRL